MRDHARVEQFGKIADDDVGAVLAQRVGLSDAVDADDEAEPARAPRGDSGECVLEDGRLLRVDAERTRGEEERVRRGLSLQVLAHERRRRRRPRRTGRRFRPPPRASRQFALEETTAQRSPASRAAFT